MSLEPAPTPTPAGGMSPGPFRTVLDILRPHRWYIVSGGTLAAWLGIGGVLVWEEIANPRFRITPTIEIYLMTSFAIAILIGVIGMAVGTVMLELRRRGNAGATEKVVAVAADAGVEDPEITATVLRRPVITWVDQPTAVMQVYNPAATRPTAPRQAGRAGSVLVRGVPVMPVEPGPAPTAAGSVAVARVNRVRDPLDVPPVAADDLNEDFIRGYAAGALDRESLRDDQVDG